MSPAEEALKKQQELEKAEQETQEMEDVDDEDDDDVAADAGAASASKKKKKKKKKKSKSAKSAAAAAAGTAGSKPPPFRGVTGFTDSYVALGQTEPPTIPVAKLFPDGKFPVGEIQEHPGDFNTHRITSEELRARDRAEEDLYEKVRYASEVHRQVRKYAQSMMKPGIRLIDLCEQLEEKNRQLVEEAGFARGIGFPTGCSLNHVAAHYTPNAGDNTVLSYGDVMKIDFGTQVDGRIIDSAFTVAFDPQFDPLLAAAKAATEEGIKSAGIDARLGEIGAAIQEVMESYEVTIDGKTYPCQVHPQPERPLDRSVPDPRGQVGADRQGRRQHQDGGRRDLRHRDLRLHGPRLSSSRTWSARTTPRPSTRRTCRCVCRAPRSCCRTSRARSARCRSAAAGSNARTVAPRRSTPRAPSRRSTSWRSRTSSTRASSRRTRRSST
ncbi:hypothetical protein PINS_up010935 [Pythium insidiosum]|nr:hypothetical protein PINS_up010935 [Pythium insidiosum]